MTTAIKPYVYASNVVSERIIQNYDETLRQNGHGNITAQCRNIIYLESIIFFSFMHHFQKCGTANVNIDIDFYMETFRVFRQHRSHFERRFQDYRNLVASNQVLPYSHIYFTNVLAPSAPIRTDPLRFLYFVYAVVLSGAVITGEPIYLPSIMSLAPSQIEEQTKHPLFSLSVFAAYEQILSMQQAEQSAQYAQDLTRRDAMVTSTFGLAGLFLSKKGAGVKLLILSIVVIVLGVFYTMLQLSYGMEPSNGIGAISVGIILVIVSIIKIVIESQNSNR